MVAFVRGRASFMRIKAFSIVYDMILEHRTLIASIYYQLNSSPLPLFSPPFLFSFFLSFLFSLSSFSVGLGLALRAIKNTPSQRYQKSANFWQVVNISGGARRSPHGLLAIFLTKKWVCPEWGDLRGLGGGLLKEFLCTKEGRLNKSQRQEILQRYFMKRCKQRRELCVGRRMLPESSKNCAQKLVSSQIMVNPRKFPTLHLTMTTTYCHLSCYCSAAAALQQLVSLSIHLNKLLYNYGDEISFWGRLIYCNQSPKKSTPKLWNHRMMRP